MSFSLQYPEVGLWNAWLFHAEDVFHLFYLKREISAFTWAAIGHAVSSDLVNWQPVADVLTVSVPGQWDSAGLTTGSIIRHHDGRYYMFYGGTVDGVQRIGVVVSDDLVHWTRCGENPVLEPAGPWYETDPLVVPDQIVPWRDPRIVYDADRQAYLAFFAARAADWPSSGGGCVGLAHSTDLLNWEVLPPAYVAPDQTCLEAIDVFEQDGAHYLLYSTAYHYGAYYPTADPHVVNGTFYLQADSWRGGWHVPTGHDNSLLGSRAGRLDGYAGRSLALGDRRLFYHLHVDGGQPIQDARGTLGSIKQLAVNAAGALTVQPFTGLVESPDTVDPPLPSVVQNPDQVDDTSYPGNVRWYGDLGDASISAALALEQTGPSAGMVIGYDAQRQQGMLVYLNRDHNTIDLGIIYQRNGKWHRAPASQSRTCGLNARRAYDLLVNVSGCLLDIYLDGRLVLAFKADVTLHGQWGLYAEGPTAVQRIAVNQAPALLAAY
jgi:beta-fructofuranosidase